MVKMTGSIFLGTLLIWMFFYYTTSEAPLNLQETLVATGIVAVVIIGAKKILHFFKNKSSK